ncbi:hypothetical protein [Paucibacter sp. KBW04]|nr:hypothetical protein [Paucibacter sp. KBW04]
MDATDLNEWARAKVATWIRHCAGEAAAEMQARADELARLARELRKVAR